MGILEYKELFMKFNRQECTGSELKKLWNWLADSSNESLIKEWLLEDLNGYHVNKSAQGVVDFSNIYKNIKSCLPVSNPEERKLFHFPKDKVWQFLRIAALFLLMFTGGGVFSFFMFNRPEQPTAVSYNEIIAPLGARSEVLLPDGSKVWLNAGSKIKYPDIFNKKNRDILLEGEAYFIVAKNARLPFNVKTADLNIVAVGTEFNVKAYGDEDFVETTLIEGSVSIWHNKLKQKKSEAISLRPLQKAVYIKEDSKLTVQDMVVIRETKPEVLKLKKGVVYVAAEINPDPIISWKENKLIFKSEEFGNILTKLERKYDVTFSYESDNIRHFRFTGILEDETLTQVLDVIKLSAPIDYELDGKTVKIFENQQMTRKFSDHLKKK
jgi:ferric-dicitrate binding protein FerR (iron transport regulator)